MPVYFIHGFRWPRALIRIHIILHNLEDSAAEWLVAPGTTAEMLDNFNQLYPDSMEHLKHLRFVEQYDPDDTAAGSGSQPYAYVADVVEEVKLGVDVDEIRGKGVPNDQWAAIMELRDQLAPEEKVAWYIVVCGDEERWAPRASGEEVQCAEPVQAIPIREREPERETVTPHGGDVQQPRTNKPPQEEQPKGIKKLFHSVSRRKSRSRVGGSPPLGGNTKTTNENGIKLQTTNLTPTDSGPESGNRSAPSAGSGQIWESNEEQEVITSTTPNDEDDSLAAPSPTVRQGPEVDNAIRKKRFSKYSVYPNPYNSTIRPVGPEAARALSPQRQSDNNIVSAITSGNDSKSPSRRQSLNFSRNPSPQALSPSGTVTPATFKPDNGSNSPPSGVSTPATFHTAYNRQSYSTVSPHTSYASANLSHQSLPPPAPSANISRQSLIMPNHQQQQQQHPLSASMSRNSLLSQASRQAPLLPIPSGSSTDVSRRSSRQTLSGMSPTVQALYGQHERDWRRSQAVLPEDLVARGLDEGVFAGLK